MHKQAAPAEGWLPSPRLLEVIEFLEPRMLLASTRVAVIGDFSSDVQVAPTRDVANLVKGWSPDAVVTVGDNNYPNGAASTIDANIGQWYSQFIYPYSGSYGSGSADGNNHFWPALGNHDWNTTNAQPYKNYFTLPGNERYYTTQVGNVGLFIVDSDSHEPDGTSSGSTQGNWLKNALAASGATWKLVVLHQPPYSSGGIGSNSYMQWPFQSWGASAVFAGHDHDYERILKNGFPYFVNGLGGESIVGFGSTVSGSQVRYAGNYGAMKLDATDTSITFQFITRTGSVIDTYTLSSTPTTNTTLIPSGSSWKYLDNGSNQGTAWRATAFSDSAWKTGNAQLGYGDGDETTVVAGNKSITTYFRKSFNVTDPSTIGSLNLNLLRDDGAVVYLNGTEVYRSNMPAGTISYTTRAVTAIGGADESTFYSADIPTSALVAGNNVIAVEIHQSDPASSDISFDLSISGTTTASGPSAPTAPSNLLATSVSSSQIQLTWSDNANNELGYKVERSTDNATFVEIAPALGNVTSFLDSGVTPGTTYYYRVRAYNNVGDSGYTNVTSATPSTTTSGSVTYIPSGATWNYLDNGSNQGTAWRAIGFNDSSWKSGAAQLGYGDGDEVTLVSYGSNPGNKFVTTYFRKAFTVSDPSQVSAITLQILRDDGAVVYVNGTEVFRTNMPIGTISYTTKAVDAIEDNTFYSATINPALLVTGANVIAVEIHQAGNSSSDISFDFKLTATVTSTTVAAQSASVAPQPALNLASTRSGFSISRDLFNDEGLIASDLL